MDDPVVDALHELEDQITAYFDLRDGPGIMLGAVVVVERRVENRGSEGSSTDHVAITLPFVGGSTHARSIGLLHWGREFLMHGGPEEP